MNCSLLFTLHILELFSFLITCFYYTSRIVNIFIHLVQFMLLDISFLEHLCIRPQQFFFFFFLIKTLTGMKNMYMN